MDDVGDLRSREATGLLDHSGNVCSNVNMTSVDSGVETGNDSNDSSTVQQDSQQHQATTDTLDTNMTAIRNTQTLDDFNRIPMMALFSERSMKRHMHYAPYSCSMISRYRNELQILRNMNKNNNAVLEPPGKVRWRKSMMQTFHNNFSLNDWQTERIQRKMRLAATTNNVTLMKRLLQFGISPNNHDEHGRTPLHISACRGYTEIVRLLLENGADPNQRDCIGNTPLHLATVNSKLSVVQPLLTAGTDVLALDSYGYNPLQLAKTKLRMLERNCINEDMLKVKEEMRNVITLLIVYLQKQENMQEQVETLSNFCSRLSLSNTSGQVQDDVKDLLANISALNITG
ncbi:hypothetical protein PUN28_015320 [Cardiocondyla obscurior]|uniref:Ankyrin repeat domain-containing protein 54 n=1 Tax=Cardiocondyla obscurior TaxID=286306 RepID=A0AAW2ESI1_9HYME